jgi:serine/threonine protein kinase
MGCCPKKKPENIDNINYTNDKKEVLNVNENTENTNTSSNKNEINIIESNNEEENEHPLNIKLTYNDFQPIKLLGRGSFGEVILVRLKSTKKVYAMKILDKKILKMKKQQNHTKTERDLMVKINSPFIVNIKSAFQDDTNLYLVSEFMQGGDMFFHMHDGQIVIFSHDKTRFYILELVLALESLHKNNMVYRDLKPENILLDSKGHVKLTDFGLSKILEDEDDKAFTLCGTPQYLAPEVLLKKGYDKMVDWWSLGCVMYEMLMGRLPFAIKRGMINLKIYEKKIDFPRKISNEARDLIEKFLVINPTERLGYGPNGTDDIKNHPFFNGVDWDLAIQKKYKPPFIPKLKNDVDLRYFDNCFTDEPIGGPKRKITIRDRDREPSNEYKGFTYMAESVSKELNNLAKSDDAE